MNKSSEGVGGPLTAEERAAIGAATLDRLSMPVWYFDFDLKAIVWANRAGMRLWRAETMEELSGRILTEDMSASVAERMNQFREDFAADATNVFSEPWTLYPKGAPTQVECVFHDGGLAPGRACTMIVARLLGEEARTPTAQRALDALRHSRMMTALCDKDGKRLFVNRALREAMGGDAVEGWFGQQFHDVTARSRFMEAVNHGRVWREVVKVDTINGPRWLDVEASPCRDAATGAQAFQVNSVDVTQIQRQAEELKQARDAAERANRAKSEFIANMSHEMRTPMNGVLGMLEVLVHTDLTEEQADMARIAQESGLALLELIEDVLDISSVELGAVSLLEDDFNPRALAAGVVEGLTAPAMRKGLGLSLHIEKNVGRRAIGDGRRIAQVMRNLIGNAIKYTDAGEVTLSLSLAPGEAEGLCVAIADTGPGVPADRREQIFERFHQEPQDGVGRADGVGLGLAICKEIVSLWGGRIWVCETEGGGACFTFTIPHAFRAATGSETRVSA